MVYFVPSIFGLATSGVPAALLVLGDGVAMATEVVTRCVVGVVATLLLLESTMPEGGDLDFTLPLFNDGPLD